MTDKFLITGDWHLTNKKPKNRTDDYVEAQRRKIDFIFDLAVKEKVNAILQPGDMFDHFNIPDSLKRDWIVYFKRRNIPIYTVPGQHDMRYHSSNINNTPIGVLDGSGVINILHDVPWVYHNKRPDDVMIYGAGWNRKVPELEDVEYLRIHILLTHQLVIKDKKEWAGQEATRAKSLLFKHGFDLIVSGDNHKSFTQERKDKHLINCGSLMRSTIDQHDHQPCVYIYYTSGKLVIHEIPVEDFVDVMDVTTASEETERNKKLEAFVDGLAEETSIEGLDFKKNLLNYTRENKSKISKGTMKLINEVMA